MSSARIETTTKKQKEEAEGRKILHMNKNEEIKKRIKQLDSYRKYNEKEFSIQNNKYKINLYSYSSKFSVYIVERDTTWPNRGVFVDTIISLEDNYNCSRNKDKYPRYLIDYLYNYAVEIEQEIINEYEEKEKEEYDPFAFISTSEPMFYCPPYCRSIQSIDILEEIDKTINNNVDNINDVKIYLKAITKILYEFTFDNQFHRDYYNTVMKKAFEYKKKI